MSFVGEQDFCEECDEPVTITGSAVAGATLTLYFSCGHTFTITRDY